MSVGVLTAAYTRTPSFPRCSRHLGPTAGGEQQQKQTLLPALALDELDLVAVGIFHEGDDGRATLHRAGLARDLAAGAPHLGAGARDIRHADGDVAEGAAHLVALDAVVVGELEHGGAVLAAVADEGERIFLIRAVGGAQ